MRQQYRIALAVLLVTIAGVILWQVSRPRELVYQDKPLSFWVNSLPVTGYAEEQLKSLGTNAIPVLLIALQTHDRFGGEIYRVSLPDRPAWVRRILPKPSPDPEQVTMGAAATLIRMGDHAKPAIPTLIGMLKGNPHFRVRLRVAFTLLGLGRGDQAVKAAMFEALNDGNWQVRAFAADALKQLDPEAAARASVVSP